MENVTVFEDLPPKVVPPLNRAMELDVKEGEIQETHDQREAIVPLEIESTTDQVNSVNKANETENPEVLKEKEPEMNALYPVFWSLQESFSTPTRLFNSQHFQVFKEGLESTIRKFQQVHHEIQARGTSKQLDENKRTLKRKRNGLDDEMSNSFNPRYLTSRDLFDLEVCRSKSIVLDF